MDNYSLFLKHEAEQEEELQKKPVCHGCGERIQDEYRYNIDGKYYCESCIEDMKESNEDFDE